MNPSWQQKKLIEYCKTKGIIINAYSPLGAKGASWGTNEVMESPFLKHIAESHSKSVAQVCLRWLYEEGVSFVVKSYNKERMKQNLEIFDWCLREEDYEMISQVKQHRTNNGPTTSLGDIWDGES
ncbi:NAD(P)H-dependent 6'-deoxychalcone synthase-like [Senna tora]|uniref:NAD(P)H-dependent 6'-deoxychalcone synthase-like n=1 Tax=Senna tora TaxID=362788 RepID=A0A834X8N2_9FABA|nr:NAD(P)H-dependent 6'-deoxychalcone synthase-like [Senna tora]